MIHKAPSYVNRIIIVLTIIIFSIPLKAQDTPFNCDHNAYLFQYNDVYAIDLASGNSFLAATDVTPGNINAAAYNPADGFIWGSLSSPSKTIVRIGNDFLTTTYYVDELPTSGRYVGDISSSGMYYLKGGGTTYYKINLDPNSGTYGQHSATETLSQNISIHDWAFNAVDGHLYAVEKGTNILYRINEETSVVESLGEVPILSGLNYTYGAVYFDASGRFYVSANQTGTIYVIQNVQDLDGSNAMNSNLFAFGPSSSSNDGARCPTAPVPQEDCTNGIDDDGDGLSDCDDPSCSGVAACPTITPIVDGGNEGGLESNNRLSEQINKRNFNRSKSNYKFDKKKAKKFKRPKYYGRKNASSSKVMLADLIPLNVINESEVIESSPLDLLNITNAKELYAVDYMKNDEIIASILLLKTEKGVYEHTKYICDRLLGAELISVSTIEINEQSFIKSIIKNVDGSMEFVLSLSAKPINSGANFSIESHWNLDKYEANADFYNFQIWSNSLDDLLNLGEEVLKLLKIQKPIVEYNNSAPPTVFVRKGEYSKGKLNLQIINRNESDAVIIDAGVRATETSIISNMSSTLNLEKKYVSNIEVETGNLFDIGFRIGDGIATPDDLFMSDGPWGIDDNAASTVVNSYTIETNQDQFEEGSLSIERNLFLNASTKEYVSAYRALTPRFKPVDLSAFNTFNLKAKGTGKMEIRLVKHSINKWEEQFKTTISLTGNFENYTIPASKFTSTNGKELEMKDIVTIIFTMVSENGNLETKEMHLENINFLYNKDLSSENPGIILTSFNDVVIAPNPMGVSTTLHFKSKESYTTELMVYDQLGRLVRTSELKVLDGDNKVTLERTGLSSGLYFCKIESNNGNYNTTQLLVR